MTVSSQTSTATFVGNGVATAFPLPFRFFDNGDIRAYFIDSVTGSATQMVLGTDYTLIGAGEPEVDGGALSLLTTTAPLASMRGLYVERVMQQLQQTDIVNQGEFFSSTHEDVFDRLTMLIQQANANSQGAIRVAIGDPEPQRLLPAARRANLLLSFDSLGNPIVVAPAGGTATDLALLLANEADPAKGSAIIGRGHQVVASIAALKQLSKTSPSKNAFVTGYYALGDGGGGAYYLDAADVVSADNGGTVIVAADGGRWKLILSDNISVLQFGAKRNVSGVDNSVYFNAALNAAADLGLGVSVPVGAYFVSNSIMMPSRGSLFGTPSSWAYGDVGFSLKSVIVVNNVHNFAALQPVIDVRLQRQTTLMWLDVNGGSANVCCVEYGSRTATGSDYNNHQIHYCQFNHATYGVRANYAGLIRASFNQFAVLTEVGLLSEFSMSDSTFISNYWNNIGQTSTSTDPYIKTGVAIWLGPNAGNAFIGGKIEWCRVGVVGVGTSYLRLDSMWMDYNTFAHVLLLGDPTGSGRNNVINGCVFSGGGVLDGGAAIDVRGNGFSMSVAITGGAIKALTDALLEDSANATYGPKLSGVKAVNSTGVISVSGVDMIKCSKQFGVYLDRTKCIDTAVCDLPNEVSNGAVRNGYAYDAGNTYRGIILRHATSDAVAAGEGVGIGAQYRNSNAVQIRLA